MNISRFVSLVSKAGLCSLSIRVAPVLSAPVLSAPVLSAPVLWAPCRNITASKDHVKFGNVGGKTNKRRELDILLGEWIYDPNNPFGDLDETFADCDRDEIPKSYLTLARNNGQWLFKLTMKNFAIKYNFILDQKFVAAYGGDRVFKVLAEQRGNNGMKFTFYTLIDKKVGFSFHVEAIQDKLFYRTKQEDGSTKTKVYLRQ